jgi:hypothetical protein
MFQPTGQGMGDPKSRLENQDHNQNPMQDQNRTVGKIQGLRGRHQADH